MRNECIHFLMLIFDWLKSTKYWAGLHNRTTYLTGLLSSFPRVYTVRVVFLYLHFISFAILDWNCVTQRGEEPHYSDAIMGVITSQNTSLTIVYPTVHSDADQRKHQSSASLAFAGNSPGTDEFPAQMASNAENASIWWRHHVTYLTLQIQPWWWPGDVQ